MITRAHHWCLSHGMRIGCLMGLAACLGCGKAPEADPEYASGRQLLADGKLKEAVAAFGKAIERNPQHALAVFYRANACERLDNTDSAITGYAKAVHLHEEIARMDRAQREKLHAVPLGDELPRAYFNRARLLNHAGKLNEAIGDFTEVLLLCPKDASAYCGRGAARLKDHFPELAIDDLTEAIRLAPNWHDAVCWRARANLAAGKYAEAIQDAQVAIHLDARCGDAFFTLGSSLLSSPDQQPDAAVKYLEKAIQLDPHLEAHVDPVLARAHFNRGVSFYKDGKRMQAEREFDEAKHRDKKYPAIVGQYIADNRPVITSPKSETVVYKPIPLDAKQLELKQIPFVSLHQQQFDELVGAFKSIRRIDPKCADAWEWCGRGFAFLEDDKDPVSAIPDLDRAICLAPDFAQAYCLRGQAYTMQGDCHQAIFDTTEAIRLKPDYTLAYFHRAVAHLKKNGFEGAQADFDEAMRLDPGFDLRSSFAKTCADQGINYLAERRWDGAIASLEIAIHADESRARQLEPQVAQAYAEQGRDHFAARRWDKAIASLEKAISWDKKKAGQLNPQRAQAYAERGFGHAGCREFQEAVADLNKAFALDKENAQVCRSCGSACCRMATDCHDRGLFAEEKAQWEAAIQYLKRAIRLDPRLESELRAPLEDAQRNLNRPVRNDPGRLGINVP